MKAVWGGRLKITSTHDNLLRKAKSSSWALWLESLTLPTVRITNGRELCQLLWGRVGVVVSVAVSGRAGSVAWLKSHTLQDVIPAWNSHIQQRFAQCSFDCSRQEKEGVHVPRGPCRKGLMSGVWHCWDNRSIAVCSQRGRHDG